MHDALAQTCALRIRPSAHLHGSIKCREQLAETLGRLAHMLRCPRTYLVPRQVLVFDTVDQEGAHHARRAGHINRDILKTLEESADPLTEILNSQCRQIVAIISNSLRLTLGFSACWSWDMERTLSTNSSPSSWICSHMTRCYCQQLLQPAAGTVHLLTFTYYVTRSIHVLLSAACLVHLKYHTSQYSRPPARAHTHTRGRRLAHEIDTNIGIIIHTRHSSQHMQAKDVD